MATEAIARGGGDSAMEWMLIVLCVCVSWTDLRYRRIPNRAILTGLAASMLIGLILWPEGQWPGRIGGGGAMLLAFGTVSWLLPNALGMGDAKLLGLLGFALGLRASIIIVTLASLLALLVSLCLLVKNRMDGRSELPFAPFVTVGLLLYCQA